MRSFKTLSLMVAVLIVMMGQVSADNSVGCGLGGYVAKDNSLISATTRSITNSTFSNQLFGITSGTSGCAQHSIVQNKVKAYHFAQVNRDNLMFDMAKGDGKYLTAFAQALGCSENNVAGFSN